MVRYIFTIAKVVLWIEHATCKVIKVIFGERTLYQLLSLAFYLKLRNTPRHISNLYTQQPTHFYHVLFYGISKLNYEIDQYKKIILCTEIQEIQQTLPTQNERDFFLSAKRVQISAIYFIGIDLHSKTSRVISL